MHYGQSRDQSAEILRLVLPLMAQQKAGFHPASFTLWYEHVAGVNPELSSYLNARIDAKQPITDDEVYQLYARHVVARDVQTLEDLQQRLRTLLEQAVEITAQAGDQTGQFERSLTDNQTRLEAADTLESASEVVATLLSESRHMQVLTHALVEKLDLRAQEVGDLRQALEKAQAEALQDPLTGLKNRRAFEAAVREISQESPHGLRGAALLLVDIDHFKQVNDSYGHLLGDKVLRAVAHVLQSNVKGRDLVARVGGEEFAVLLLQATSAGALALAEQIRLSIAQGKVRSTTAGEHIGAVTISAGLAVAAAGESLEVIFQRADGALYEAKRTGRNRVCTSSPEASGTATAQVSMSSPPTKL